MPSIYDLIFLRVQHINITTTTTRAYCNIIVVGFISCSSVITVAHQAKGLCTLMIPIGKINTQMRNDCVRRIGCCLNYFVQTDYIHTKHCANYKQITYNSICTTLKVCATTQSDVVRNGYALDLNALFPLVVITGLFW